MKRVAITGGKESGINPGIHVLNSWLHEYFKEKYEIIQLSRATGYDFYKNYDDIVNIGKTCDIFVNSACVEDFQIKLLEDLYDKVPNLICLGSVAGDFHEAPQSYENHVTYPQVKFNLMERCKFIPLERMSSKTNLLYLNITETEDLNYGVEGLQKNQLTKILDFWIENPYVKRIDLKFFIGEMFKTHGKRKKIDKVLAYYKNKKNDQRN
jgi:hypothetical protein